MARNPVFEEDLLVEIDPAVLDAAMASVDRHLRKPARTDATEVTVDLEGEETTVDAGEAAWAEERKRWLTRQLELSDKLQKLQKEVKKSRDEREEMQKQLEEAKKVLAERTAEFESTRQRQRKDREEAERVAEERVLRPLLDIVDNLERAAAHAAGDPTKVAAGLQMIMDQFRNQLRRYGAERIVAHKGLAFDPEVHEAVLHMPTQDWPAGVVIEEVSAGFRLKGRLLRAARVVVAASNGAE